jgi:hypothetical protein
MSGNIHDTDVKKIRLLVNDYINELDDLLKRGENIDINVFKKKYDYLFKTSENLFNMIYNQYVSSTFDKTFFLNNLQIMLNAIENIQKQKVSQYDASCEIGEMLATHYIPHLKK